MNEKTPEKNKPSSSASGRTCDDSALYFSAIFAAWLIAAAFAAAVILTGCASQTLARGITTKNVSGNGTVIDSHIGLDPDTKIPELETIFISGDFSTAKAGTNSVCCREESSASVWNASSVTKKRFLCITLTDKGDLPAVIRAVAEVMKSGAANAPQTVSGDADSPAPASRP